MGQRVFTAKGQASLNSNRYVAGERLQGRTPYPTSGALKEVSSMPNVFICHASEDKQNVARPLAQTLQAQGLDVWYDEFTLTIGDSLGRTIDAGLAKCDYGIVILSRNFFGKKWPARELDGLVAKEVGEGRKVILPIWHDVDEEAVRRFSPTLAAKVAADTSCGLDSLSNAILGAIKIGSSSGTPPTAPSASALRHELNAHVSALRDTLVVRFPAEMKSGHVDVTAWPEARHFDEWLCLNRLRLPGAVRAALDSLARSYMDGVNNHLEFLRQAVASGESTKPEKAIENQARLESLIDLFDKEARSLRQLPWA